MKLILNALVAIMIVLGFSHAVAHAAEGQEKSSFATNANDFLKNTQRFLVGTIIGMAHGAANKAAENVIDKNSSNARKALHTTTFLASTYAAYKYEPLLSLRFESKPAITVIKSGNKILSVKIQSGKPHLINDNYKLVSLGHGVGQWITETAVDACKNEKFKLNVNLSLGIAFALYALNGVFK